MSLHKEHIKIQCPELSSPPPPPSYGLVSGDSVALLNRFHFGSRPGPRLTSGLAPPSYWESGHRVVRGLWEERFVDAFFYFPTCQVRVVRFYVSLFFSSFSFSFSSASSSVSLSCCDSVCSVWHVGPQLRSCEFSVSCWTPTAIL